MPQITLEGLKGISNAAHFLMRPEDFNDLPQKTRTLLQLVIDEQEMELIPYTFVAEPQNETIHCKIPNFCEPVFNWLNRYFYGNTHLIKTRPFTDSIISLQKLYKDPSINPEGWIIPYDKTPKLTKLNIKHIIEFLDLTDSMDKIGNYHHEDYIFFQTILISEMIGERSFIEIIDLKTEGKLDFLYLVKHARPKKNIPCVCADCGMLFLNQSHPAKYCKKCKKKKEDAVKNRICACGCGENLPEKFPNKQFFNKACITRDRRKREKDLIFPVPSEVQQLF